MTTATAPPGNALNFPPALRTAQEAIHLPEVQQMLHRLSEHGLGIFMPHVHDELTGELQPLPQHITQVESGLKVSFQLTENIVSQKARFLPVGWCWRAGALAASAVCEMVQDDLLAAEGSPVKHKMPMQN